MPRRTANEARAAAAKQTVTRMHYVIRNPRFREELEKEQSDDAVAALAEKWR